ncbi:hypothetical protein SK128_013123 [Halocaridina rubra]|uniref:Uncharacterized protein n=1 Tax=Halocaridina rubra TaxID=373956 RepID=A0AAN8X2Z8_HALRR
MRHSQEDINATSSRKLLIDLYNCQFDRAWLSWARARGNSFNPDVKALRGLGALGNGRRFRTFSDVITEYCLKSHHRVIKRTKIEQFLE